MCQCLADAFCPIKTVCADGPGSSQSYSLELMWLFQIAVIITALLITWIFHSQAHYGPSIFPSFFFFSGTRSVTPSLTFFPSHSHRRLCLHTPVAGLSQLMTFLKLCFFITFSALPIHTPTHTVDWVSNMVALLHTTCQWNKTALTW